MALSTTHKPVDGEESVFSVGDVVKVHQRIKEGEKSRVQVYEGTVIKIKGRGVSKTFTVRRIGAQMIGIERIFPVNTPIIEKIEVVKPGKRGVRRSKLYYIRDKSRKEISRIYSRTNKREAAKEAAKNEKPKAKKKNVAKKDGVKAKTTKKATKPAKKAAAKKSTSKTKKASKK